MSFIIKNREDYDKLEKYKKTKEKLFENRLKEKLGNQSFYYDMKQVFEPSIEEQKESTKKIIKSQESTQKAITEGNQNLQNAITTGMDNLKYLVNSNIVDSNIVTTLSNMINNKNRSQFSLNQIKDNKFQINPTNPQNVIIKGSHMIFDNGNEYDFDNTDVSYYATTPNLDKTKITDRNLIRRFYKDAKYDFNKPGDKKSNRYYYTREFENNAVEARGVMLDQRSIQTKGLIFLPSDPNELVDRLYLLYQEKIAGNDSKKYK